MRTKYLTAAGVVMAFVTGLGIYSATARVLPVTAALSPQDCDRYSGLPQGFGADPLAGMLAVPAGHFTPGSNDGYADERPAGAVQIDAFMIDRTEVTNAQFAAFIDATGYITEAEREGGAVVFQAPEEGVTVQYNGWWRFQKGANWRHPEGPNSHLEGRDNHPVVQVTEKDALAYAHWLGRELPNEAQWEWAALGGGDQEQLEREPRSDDGKASANYWQGVFPYINTAEDGFIHRSPVGCYPANGYGLNDMIGNVWEWTTDPYLGPRQYHGNGDPASILSKGATDQAYKVIKGGSFLCAKDYCVRYRTSARYPQEANLGVAHVGFRTVLNLKSEQQ
ncbi:formylglycine-generating enzyme family protein [Amphritea sp.]|uniref:formylglycine-generating enzyme family protein n=1 Tax=Amphritea sp. TaxID=1872502 RepID=UPI003A8CBD83